MKKIIPIITILLILFSCSEDSSTDNPQNNPPVELPGNIPPDVVLTCECYYYVSMGGYWYGKKYYCSPTTIMEQHSTPPETGVWICPD